MLPNVDHKAKGLFSAVTDVFNTYSIDINNLLSTVRCMLIHPTCWRAHWTTSQKTRSNTDGDVLTLQWSVTELYIVGAFKQQCEESRDLFMPLYNVNNFSHRLLKCVKY